MKLVLSIIMILIFSSCKEDLSNYRDAYIKKSGQDFTVILKRKGSLHPAGPFDIGKTYEDSIKYIIPRDTGTIKANELPEERGSYPWSGGTITINGNKLKIELYFNDTDDKKIMASTWNGEYNLVGIK